MNNILIKFAELSSRVDSNGGQALGAAGALIVFLIFASIFVFVAVVAVFWVLSFIHVLQHDDVKDRTLWIVLLLVFGGITGLIYHFAVRKPYEHQKSVSAKKK